MKSKSYLENELESAHLKAKYDEHAKRLLKDKNVLAYILRYAVKEFKGYSLEEAKSAIEGEPEVSTRIVRPDSSNRAEAINGAFTESNLPGEGKMYFDIVFFVRTKDNSCQKLYINLEAQKSFYPGYDLVTRGVVYASRLISEQMDVEYTATNYDGVKKVYSIWICMNTPEENQKHEDVSDTITEYSLTPQTVYPKDAPEGTVAYGRYDLLAVVFICLKNDTVNSQNKLIGMLSTLLSSEMSLSEKKEKLEKKYHLPMTKNMESEAVAMCNLSEAIEEAGINRGRSEGLIEGRSEGLSEGLIQGYVLANMKRAKKLHWSERELLDYVMEDCNCTEKEAKELIKKYSDCD